jgi:hypothetical protein
LVKTCILEVFWGLHDFLQYLQANAVTVPRLGHEAFPSKHFLIHYTRNILPLGNTYSEIQHSIFKYIINKKFWEELIAYFPWYDTGHIENDASNNSSIVARVFVTAVTFLRCRFLATTRGFLPSRCLVTIRKFLPSRSLATTGAFLQGRCLATIRGLLPCGCLATIGGIQTHTQTAKWSGKVTLFLQNKESRLKKKKQLTLHFKPKWRENLCLKRYGGECSPYVRKDVKMHAEAPRIHVCTWNNQMSDPRRFYQTARSRRRNRDIRVFLLERQYREEG